MTKRLLTAEDHPVVVAALEEVLNNNGFRVVGVSQRWDRVVDDYANLLPDVCLIDVRGPPDDGTGLDAAAAVQKRPGGFSCVYKRYGNASAIDMGCKGCISKTSHLSELIRTLHAASVEYAH